MKKRILIHGIGELYTGELASPRSSATSIAIAEGRIIGFGADTAASPDGHWDVVINAAGAAL